MKALAAMVLAEVGIGLLPVILPGLLILLLIAYVLIRPLWWLAVVVVAYKLGSRLVAKREQISRGRLDVLDPVPVDKSHGRNVG